MPSVVLRSSRRFDDLSEHTGGRPGVHERDARAADAGARLLVDQREPGPFERFERAVDVVDLVGDMVQARAVLREELADGRVRAERREQLDVVLADVEQDRLDALLLDDLAMRERELEAVAIQRERRRELLDGDADVVDPREHAQQFIGECASRRSRTARTVASPRASDRAAALDLRDPGGPRAAFGWRGTE